MSHAGQEKDFEIQLPGGQVHFRFQFVKMSLTALNNPKQNSSDEF